LAIGFFYELWKSPFPTTGKKRTYASLQFFLPLSLFLNFILFEGLTLFNRFPAFLFLMTVCFPSQTPCCLSLRKRSRPVAFFYARYSPPPQKSLPIFFAVPHKVKSLKENLSFPRKSLGGEGPPPFSNGKFFPSLHPNRLFLVKNGQSSRWKGVLFFRYYKFPELIPFPLFLLIPFPLYGIKYDPPRTFL